VASVLSHPAVALGLAPWLRRAGLRRRALLLGVLCAVIPDVDAVGFWLGIPYGAPLGHRGLTHSILFAAVLAGALTAAGPPAARLPLFVFLLLCAASHGVFDAMTDGGLGVAFFAPFENARYFFPWRPIRVSPIGLGGFFGRRGLAILESEALWIWLPSAMIGCAGWVLGVRGRGPRPSNP
jgi:inner membrane protein